MKQNTTLKSLVFAAALTLGGAASALAQNANVAVPNPAETGKSGLIGSRYTQVEYNYINLTGWGPKDAKGFGVAFNQPVNANFDLTVNYDWARAVYSPARVHQIQQELEVAATAYTTLEWGRPFATVGAGWTWDRINPSTYKDDSFNYRVGVGMEFLPVAKLAVTPFANFVRATHFSSNEVEMGAKVSYELTSSWSADVRAQYVDVRHGADYSSYGLGATYRF